MRTRSPIKALWLTAVLLASPVPAWAEEILDRIVAVAGEEVVLASELEQEVEGIRSRFFQQGQQPPPADELREQVLEQLVMQRLQLNHARRAGVEVDEATLDAAVQRIAAQNNLTLSQLRDALAQQGMSMSEFRQDLREQITIDRLHQAVMQQEVDVSPREVEEALEAASAGDTHEYRVAHIRVGTPEGASPEELEAAEERARELRRRTEEPDAEFTTLAQTFSDAASADEGGVLGWRLPDQLPSGLGDAATGLEPGEISEVVQAADGYHIVKLLDRRREGAEVVEETRARQILIRPDPEEGITDDDARQRLESFRERIAEGESLAFLARAHSDAPGAEADGGDLGWTAPGEVVPGLQERLDALEPGEISEPFRSEQGWHLVRVEDRRERDLTEERRREQIARQIQERKGQEALEQWLRELRAEAYVDYRLEGP